LFPTLRILPGFSTITPCLLVDIVHIVSNLPPYYYYNTSLPYYYNHNKAIIGGWGGKGGIIPLQSHAGFHPIAFLYGFLRSHYPCGVDLFCDRVRGRFCF
jgi:hypothetical protein